MYTVGQLKEMEREKMKMKYYFITFFVRKKGYGMTTLSIEGGLFVPKVILQKLKEYIKLPNAITILFYKEISKKEFNL